MIKPDRSKNTYKTYKILITILILIIFGCLGYMYNISSRSKSVIIKLKSEKLTILEDLEKAKIKLIAEASQNQQLSGQLLQEKNKIDSIIKQLSKPNVSNETIAKYKNYVLNLNLKVDSLSKTVTKYKIIIDSSKIVISNKDNEQKILLKEKNSLQGKIAAIANNLNFYNLNANSFKKKDSGKAAETKKASKVKMITIKFEIAENKLANKQVKVFYFQIIDSKNNVIGLKSTVYFGKKELIYSESTSVEYNLTREIVEKNIVVQNLEKGTYLINVFDNDKLILTNNLNLE